MLRARQREELDPNSMDLNKLEGNGIQAGLTSVGGSGSDSEGDSASSSSSEEGDSGSSDSSDSGNF